MQGQPTRAWGKLDRPEPEAAVVAWHPLVDHCADVAAVTEALLAHPLFRRRLERLAGQPLDHPGLTARLCAIAFLHDLGKANSGFQAKRLTPDELRLAGIEPAGHVREAGGLLFGQSDLAAATLPVESLSSWGAAFTPLLIASISHHGVPFKVETGAASVWRPAGGYDPAEGLRALGAALTRWFPAAFESQAPELPTAAAFQHAFAGLVQLADWLGSHRGFFPYTEETEEENRFAAARRMARSALETVGLEVSAARKTLTAAAPSFAEVFPGLPEPRDFQTAMADPELGRLAVLEAETGSGKTEAALWRFKHLFETGAVDGLYFALPTRVAASAMYERVKAAARRLFGAAAPPVVRAVPGYAAVEEAEVTAILPDFTVLWTDKLDGPEAHRRWAAENPKRFLAAPIAVGTIDQALLGVLRTKHAHLRAFALTRSLLIVDEVHASDVYMTALLRRLLAWQLRSGGQALLMSATLGGEVRAELTGAELTGAGAPERDRPDLASALAAPYPALSAPGLLRGFAQAREKRVRAESRPSMESPETVAGLALEAARAGARVLVVRNTVDGAVGVQSALETLSAQDEDLLFRCAGLATLHHGRFARADRILLDRAVETSLGKTAERRGGRVLVGTQTLEQSLDLDADLLITDLCPADVLLQRIGRLHRHSRPRPAGFEQAKVIVLEPSAGLATCLERPRHGLGPLRDGRGVYPNVIAAEATRRQLALEPMLVLPQDNRSLVEAATHGEALRSLAESLGPDWIAHWQQMEGVAFGDLSTAANVRFDPDQRFDKLDTWRLKETVATRLGLRDRIVHFPEPPTSPFGSAIRQLNIPAHLAPDVGAEVEAKLLSQESEGFTFRLATREFIYRRHGLARSAAPSRLG